MKSKENKSTGADMVVSKVLGIAILIAGSVTLLCAGGLLGLAVFFVSFALFCRAWEHELDQLYAENERFFASIADKEEAEDD